MNLKRAFLLLQIFIICNIFTPRNDFHAAAAAAAATTIEHAADAHQMDSFSYDMSDLILNYFENYKHIKRLTLFFCSPPITSGLYRNGNIAKLEQSTDEMPNEEIPISKPNNRKYLNLVNTVRYLMTFGNFLIKGDGNIDMINFDVNGFYMKNMLKCGDFREGVVLDLSCRQSKFILQQVNICYVEEFSFLKKIYK